MMTSQESDTDIQVADFGLSKFAAPEEIMNLPCGTLAYVAPEVLQMTGYGREVDLWSIGVIMYVLLRGRLPFDAKHKDDIIEKTIKGALPMEGDPVWDQVSPEAKALIRRLLCPDPKKRITVSEALNDPWILSQDNKDNKETPAPRLSTPPSPPPAGGAKGDTAPTSVKDNGDASRRAVDVANGCKDGAVQSANGGSVHDQEHRASVVNA